MKKQKKTRSYHHGNLRDSCISAGLELLEKSGDFSLRDVARHLGVSHGAPYNHFESKEALLAAIAEQGFLLFGSYLEKAHQKDCETYFKKMGESYMSFAQSHPQHYRLMFSDAIKDHRCYDSLASAGLGCFQRLLNMVDHLKTEGYFRQHPTHATAVMIWSTMHGYASLVIEKRTGPLENASFIDFFDQINHMLLHGLVESRR